MLNVARKILAKIEAREDTRVQILAPYSHLLCRLALPCEMGGWANTLISLRWLLSSTSPFPTGEGKVDPAGGVYGEGLRLADGGVLQLKRLSNF